MITNILLSGNQKVDLIDITTKTFYHFDQMSLKCNIQNFLKYYSLITSIICSIKKQLEDSMHEMTTSELKNTRVCYKFFEKIKNSKSIQYLYVDLIKDIYMLPNHKIDTWKRM